MTRITRLEAFEILDSRGRPTLAVHIAGEDGTEHVAGVPSGASTGGEEAVELRDGDDSRYAGRGVLSAVASVNGPVADTLVGRSVSSIHDVDDILLDLDGTAKLSQLGANAVVGVSMASARLLAAEAGVPLWRYLGPRHVAPSLPVPHFNVVNGGAHAAGPLAFQEFMLAPVGAPSFAEALQAGAEVYSALRALLVQADHRVGLGDEGGFAPDLAEPEDVLSLLVGAIEDAGYPTGAGGVGIALDPAANGFHDGDAYTVAGKRYDSSQLVDYYDHLWERFPIVSLEDGLAEDDWDGWELLTRRLGERVQLVGDDIFVTDPAVIRSAAARGVANAALIKVNQIGTVSQTLEALAACRDAGYAAMISHRSGETTDTFIADLAVGSGCGQIKSGAPARGERVAKYNRLREIEHRTPGLPYAGSYR